MFTPGPVLAQIGGVREGDRIVIQPWEFQDEKANVCMRYTKTQSLYLSRKGVLPEIVDLFGMSTEESQEAREPEQPREVEPGQTQQPEPGQPREWARREAQVPRRRAA